MSYPKRALKLRPIRGFVSDTPAHEVGPDFYTGCSNVIFRNGFAQRILGQRSTYETALATVAASELMHAINAEVSGTNYWLLFEDDGTAWAIEGTNAAQIDDALLSAVTDPFRFASALLNGIPIITNGSDEPVYWAGADLITLPGWTATESCESIAVFKYHIFAMDISGPGGEFPNLVKWSSAAEPGTIPDSWTPAADNEAGSTELSDAPGPVLCAVPMRDTLVFYKRSSMYGAQYVGGNLKYQFRKLQSASGALTRRSVCDVNGQHLVVTDGDIVLTDGTGRRSVGESKIKNYFFNQLAQDTYSNVFCTFNRAKNEAVIGFPLAGSDRCNLALVYDVGKDSFGVRELPSIAHAPVGYINDESPSNTWADRVDTWAEAVDTWGSSSLAAATDALVFVAGDELLQQDAQDATAVAATIGKHDMTFDDPERVKFVKRVHVRARSGFGTLLVRVGARMTPTDSVSWSTEVPLVEPAQFVNTFAQGRYISVEIRSIGSDVWTVTGIDIEAEMRGYH